ncbi:hypothetical protein BDV96DRAFT_398476 [Lophiotrema nucula]|uniref:Uncharacterized protein n=1 Tax=Lophiotrema nucula TaxID=690887 RepID=A0A6A5ZET5_9PLEO|nr:hypothetical protein BDV96DRAFT_398476 [Lophiotrema nucula]
MKLRSHQTSLNYSRYHQQDIPYHQHQEHCPHLQYLSLRGLQLEAPEFQDPEPPPLTLQTSCLVSHVSAKRILPLLWTARIASPGSRLSEPSRAQSCLAKVQRWNQESSRSRPICLREGGRVVEVRKGGRSFSTMGGMLIPGFSMISQSRILLRKGGRRCLGRKRMGRRSKEDTMGGLLSDVGARQYSSVGVWRSGFNEVWVVFDVGTLVRKRSRPVSTESVAFLVQSRSRSLLVFIDQCIQLSHQNFFHFLSIPAAAIILITIARSFRLLAFNCKTSMHFSEGLRGMIGTQPLYMNPPLLRLFRPAQPPGNLMHACLEVPLTNAFAA